MKTKGNPWLGFLLIDRYVDLALLLLRLFAGGLLFVHGVAKLEHYAALRNGFPDPIGWGGAVSLVMIILVEIGCSLLVVSGLLTRFALIPMIFSMIMAMTTHGGTGLGSVELPLLYVGMFVVLFVSGPGRYSIDRLIGKVLRRPEA